MIEGQLYPFEIKGKQGKFLRITCKLCKQDTFHSVISQLEGPSESFEGEFWHTEFFTLQCEGCSNVCLLEESYDNGDYNYQTNGFDTTKKIFPSPYPDKHTLMEGIWEVPKELRVIYSESVKAFNYELGILCAIGIRAVIESICRERKIRAKNLEKRIDKLVEENIVTAESAKLLHLLRNLGNFSAHEMKKHEEEVLKLCLQIVDTMLFTLYVLPRRAVPVIDSLQEEMAAAQPTEQVQEASPVSAT